MAKTFSTMKLKLGETAAAFRLPAANGYGEVSLHSLRAAKGYLIVFTCCHCPFAVHVADELSRIAKQYSEKGIQTVAISSNDAQKFPNDSMEAMTAEAKKRDFQFPFLYDESQEVAQAYFAACTPDFFVFNEKRELFYRGQMDSSRPGDAKLVTGEDLRQNLDALIQGKPAFPPEKQIPSMGCNIKWKDGNLPSYA